MKLTMQKSGFQKSIIMPSFRKSGHICVCVCVCVCVACLFVCMCMLVCIICVFLCVPYYLQLNIMCEFLCWALNKNTKYTMFYILKMIVK